MKRCSVSASWLGWQTPHPHFPIISPYPPTSLNVSVIEAVCCIPKTQLHDYQPRLHNKGMLRAMILPDLNKIKCQNSDPFIDPITVV
jgi:hypothetical protein